MPEISDDFDQAWDDYDNALKKLHSLEADPFVTTFKKELQELKVAVSKARDKINNLYMELGPAQKKSPDMDGLYNPNVYVSMEHAPTDGTVVMLLIDRGFGTGVTGFEPGEYLFWTLGVHDPEDNDWQFVDWDESAEIFIGLHASLIPMSSFNIVGWKPFPVIKKVIDE